MKDAVGTEIEIGDKVFYSCISGHSHIISTKEVAGFTPKMIRTTETNWAGKSILISPDNCVVYETKDGKRIR